MTRDVVLVGVDGSAGSANAFRWAAARAESAGADLRVTTAWETPVLAGLPVPSEIALPTQKELTSLANELLDETIATLGPNPSVAIERSIRRGRPGHAILEDAERCRPDLIVVGTHGHSTVTRVLLGSVSRHVATHAEVPVAVIPASRATEIRDVVRVGVDQSAGSKAALNWISVHTACPIEAVHVWDVPRIYGVAEYPADDVERFANEMLDQLIGATPGLDGRDIRLRVVRGDPREQLLDDGDGPQIAALVVGRRRGGPLSSLFGSVSMFVASHAVVPVVVVPPQPKIRAG